MAALQCANALKTLVLESKMHEDSMNMHEDSEEQACFSLLKIVLLDGFGT